MYCDCELTTHFVVFLSDVNETEEDCMHAFTGKSNCLCIEISLHLTQKVTIDWSILEGQPMDIAYVDHILNLTSP